MTQPAPDAAPSPPVPAPQRRWGRIAALGTLLALAGGAVWAHEEGWDTVFLTALGDPSLHPWRKQRPERPPLVLVRTFPTPARPWTIVLDPGHGGDKPGTLGVHNGVHEKAINLQVTLSLAERLKLRKDMRVILTRTDDRDVTINRRWKLANGAKADLFVSIHGNATSSPRVQRRGFMAIWSQRQTQTTAAARSPWLASWLGAALVDAGFRPARAGVDLEDPRPPNTVDYRTSWDTYGAFATDRKELGVLDYTDVPAVLVETHYMNNASEVEALVWVLPKSFSKWSAACAVESLK